MKKAHLWVLVLWALAFGSTALGAEGTPVSEPMAGRIRTAIEGFLNKETAQKGAVEVEDAKAGKTLRLTLDKVHEGVTALGDGMHRACVDMKDASGAVYDVDVIVHAHEDEVHFVNKVLHKAGGEDRLNMEPVEKTHTDEHAHP